MNGSGKDIEFNEQEKLEYLIEAEEDIVLLQATLDHLHTIVTRMKTNLLFKMGQKQKCNSDHIDHIDETDKTDKTEERAIPDYIKIIK
jgi:hypothetical protein